MSFIDNIRDSIGAPNTTLNPPFRAVMFGDGAIYLEGVKQILSFKQEEIVISVKNGGLKITGEGLFVKKYCLGDLVVCGKICCLTKL